VSAGPFDEVLSPEQLAGFAIDCAKSAPLARAARANRDTTLIGYAYGYMAGYLAGLDKANEVIANRTPKP
jgi:hypothetical protein